MSEKITDQKLLGLIEAISDDIREGVINCGLNEIVDGLEEKCSLLTEKAVQTISRRDEPLGYGFDGTVYALDEETVLKLSDRCFYRRSSENNAKYEFKVGRHLYQQDVQVPRYFGLFRPISQLEINYWGIFMERIHGVKVSELNLKLLEMAKRQYEQQKELITKLGYYTEDSFFGYNMLFDITKEKLFLYDLVRWEPEPRKVF